ncbi:MAG TPA: ATP-grasp domain-containing protein [Streptosporangiaceae bacterium]|nr:ATP-grasp domain-containing protein [Streptosporangiaceae bacterium]
MSAGLPRLAVLYEMGAASPWEISAGLAGLAEVIFAVPRTGSVAGVLPLLEELGTLLSLTGDPVTDSASLRRLGAAGIVSYSESMLRDAASIAAEAGLPYESTQVAVNLTNKFIQRKLLREAGIDEVRSHPLWSAADWPAAAQAVRLPAVLKPARGAASFNTNVITTAGQAERIVPAAFAASAGHARADGEPVLVLEEFLPGRPSEPYGDYVSVECLSGAGGTTAFAITGKLPMLPPFRECGHFWPSQLPAAEQAQIRDLAAGAVRALGVRRGLAHVEIKLTAAGPRIIEVNGRLGGWTNRLSIASTGTDLVRLAARLALGEDVTPPVPDPGKVHFIYDFVAPIEPCVLEGMHGRREVLGIPEVAGCQVFYRIGDRLPGGIRTNDLALIWGTAATHDAMISAIEQVGQSLAVDLRFAGGVRQLTAAALRQEATAYLGTGG